MCPEGISCYVDDENVPYDNWNCMCGIWQAYSIHDLYNAIIHIVVGVDLDECGLTVYPYSGEEMKLLGLHFVNNMTFDIEVKGSGEFVKSIEINGIVIEGTNKLPVEFSSEYNSAILSLKKKSDTNCNL